MIAFGRLASISATGMVDGTISEYTWHSRTRRAISCAYCAPKSTTRTVSKPPGTLFTFRWNTDGRRRGQWRGLDRGDAQAGDAAAVELGHRDGAARHLHAVALRRQVAQGGQDVA